MVAMLGLMRTDLTLASLSALSACDPLRSVSLGGFCDSCSSRLTGVVELAGLADTQTAGADDEDLLDVDEVLCAGDDARVYI